MGSCGWWPSAATGSEVAAETAAPPADDSGRGPRRDAGGPRCVPPSLAAQAIVRSRSCAGAQRCPAKQSHEFPECDRNVSCFLPWQKVACGGVPQPSWQASSAELATPPAPVVEKVGHAGSSF